MTEPENDFPLIQYEWELALQFTPAQEAGLPEKPPKVTFAIDNDEKLAWFVGKLIDRQQQIERVNEQAARITRAFIADRDGLITRFRAEAEAYIRAKLAYTSSKKRCIDLLTGRTGFRQQPGDFKIVNEGDALKWAEANMPNTVRTTTVKNIDKIALKKHMRTTGEIIPGADYIEARDKWYVEGVSIPE